VKELLREIIILSYDNEVYHSTNYSSSSSAASTSSHQNQNTQDGLIHFNTLLHINRILLTKFFKFWNFKRYNTKSHGSESEIGSGSSYAFGAYLYFEFFRTLPLPVQENLLNGQNSTRDLPDAMVEGLALRGKFHDKFRNSLENQLIQRNLIHSISLISNFPLLQARNSIPVSFALQNRSDNSTLILIDTIRRALPKRLYSVKEQIASYYYPTIPYLLIPDLEESNLNEIFDFILQKNQNLRRNHEFRSFNSTAHLSGSSSVSIDDEDICQNVSDSTLEKIQSVVESETNSSRPLFPIFSRIRNLFRK
jgi:hypothetical protein